MIKPFLEIIILADFNYLRLSGSVFVCTNSMMNINRAMTSSISRKISSFVSDLKNLRFSVLLTLKEEFFFA